MGQIKHKMGNVGGGVDISHKSKMSGKAKSLMSFPGGMPGPGNYGSSDNKVVGRGMAKYLAGESVGMRKMDPMHNGKPGVQQEDFEQFSAPDSTGPAKRSRAQRQEDRDKAKTKRRAGRADKRVIRNKAKVKKLQDKIDDGKEVFNVDKAGNNTTGRKANRIARAKKKITDNEKISAKNPKKEPPVGEIGVAKYDDGPMKKKKSTVGKKTTGRKPTKKMTKEELKKSFRKPTIAESLTEKKVGSKGKGPMKTDPEKEVTVSGDKSKVDNKVVGAKEKARLKQVREDRKKIKKLKKTATGPGTRKTERSEMKKVNQDTRDNRKVQKQRRKDGKSYMRYNSDGTQTAVRKKLKE